jgi:aldose sugar dehydrogenase
MCLSRPTSWLLFTLVLIQPLAAQLRDARIIYRENCVFCHGQRGEGVTAPSLLDGQWRHGDSDEAIARIIREGTPDRTMPGFGAMLDDQAIRTLVVYLRELETNYRRHRDVLPLPADTRVHETADHRFRLETVVADLDTPWGMTWLPDGRMLVTEKPGRLRLVENGRLQPLPIAGIPAVFSGGQGGLLDVVLHPDYANNGWIYLAYSDVRRAGGREVSLTKITRGRLRDHAFVDQETIWEAAPAAYVPGGVHWGTRMVFDAQGYLFFAHGERGRPDLAQDLTHPAGKHHRIHDDGRIPADNPLLDVPGAVPSIWTYGNRNPQGLAIDPATGLLWSAEHGPRGGDELNLLHGGANYGWPVVTHGMNYNGTPITAETHREGLEPPVIHWTPSIAVCGIAFYPGEHFPAWRGDLLVTALAQQHLRRVVIRDQQVVHQEILFEDYGRARHVAIGPDGLIYVALNTPDVIVRLVPAD